MSAVRAARKLVLASGLDHRVARRIVSAKQAQAVIGMARQFTRRDQVVEIEAVLAADDNLRRGVRAAFADFHDRDAFGQRNRAIRRKAHQLALGVVLLLALMVAGGLLMVTGPSAMLVAYEPVWLGCAGLAGGLIYALVYGLVTGLGRANVQPVTDLRYHQSARNVDLAELV